MDNDIPRERHRETERETDRKTDRDRQTETKDKWITHHKRMVCKARGE